MFYVRQFRAGADGHVAETLREAAKDYPSKQLISQSEYDLLIRETQSAVEALRAEWKPDPSMPFHGCHLPREIAAVELVSSDARAAGWSRKCLASHSSDSILEWLENGMQEDEFDQGDEVLVYDDEGSPRSLHVEELLEATLAADGRFELRDGTEFYLLDEAHVRWYPQRRAR